MLGEIVTVSQDSEPIMSLTTALLSALSIVTSALGVAVGKLWQASEECAKDRLALRNTLEEYIAAHAHNEGRLEAYEACPAESCPFSVEATTKTARVPKFAIKRPHAS